MKTFSFVTKLLLISFTSSISIFGQQKDREIKRTVWKDEPIKITTVKVRNKEVKIKQKFTENDDWLKGLSIEIQNISSKVITYLEIELTFPQDKDGMPSAPATEFLKYGVIPLPSSNSPITKSSEPSLRPNDKATLKIPSHEKLQELLNYAGHSETIEDITVKVGRVVFSDGTMWNREQIFKRDPNNPRTWILSVRQEMLKPQETLLASLVVNKNRINFLPFLPIKMEEQSDCYTHSGDGYPQCNTYACYAIEHLKGANFGDVNKRWRFQEETI